MKRIAAVALVICFALLGTFNSYADTPLFSDVPGHWAQPYIDKLVERGVITGSEDGLFHPDMPITTSQFVSMILMSKYGKMNPVNDDPASGYVDYAYKNGIINEYDLDTKEEPLIRRFAARIGHTALLNDFKEEDEKDWSAAEKLQDLYTCKTCVLHVAQFYIKGIMLGRSDGIFDVNGNLTKAEAAVVIMRMLDPSLRNPQKNTAPSEDNSKEGMISPEAVKAIMESDKTALLIDVRSQEEHKASYILGSICVPLDEMMQDLQQTVIPPEKDTTIIVYCQKGIRSQKAFQILKEAGYTKVYNLGAIEDWPYEMASE